LRREKVIWLIFAERLQRIARLLSGSFCASRISSKALHESKRHLITALLILITKMELSESGLQQSNGLAVISFKSQLSELRFEGKLIRSHLVYD
jgi:hypothetical protein